MSWHYITYYLPQIIIIETTCVLESGLLQVGKRCCWNLPQRVVDLYPVGASIWVGVSGAHLASCDHDVVCLRYCDATRLPTHFRYVCYQQYMYLIVFMLIPGIVFQWKWLSVGRCCVWQELCWLPSLSRTATQQDDISCGGPPADVVLPTRGEVVRFNPRPVMEGCACF